jgi:hypothetical protein
LSRLNHVGYSHVNEWGNYDKGNQGINPKISPNKNQRDDNNASDDK